MSTEHPEGGQPAGQLSPDGKWRWDGHNWVPAQQQYTPPQPQYTQPQQPQPQQPQYGQPAQPQAQYGQAQYPQPQYGQPAYAGMPGTPQKKGMPVWGKVLLVLAILFVGLIGLLTAVGLAVSDDYADWSCEDVADEALTIDEDKDEMLSLTGVSDLEIVEDNRKDFEAPADGRGVVLSCEGTGEWTDLGEAPVLVVLEAGEDGDEWVRYEMTD